MIVGGLVVVILVLVIAVLWQRNRLVTLQGRYDLLEIRAAAAEKSLQVMQSVAKKTEHLEEVLRAQTIAATSAEHLSRRADFAGDWLPGADADLSTSAQVGATDAAGVADDQA